MIEQTQQQESIAEKDYVGMHPMQHLGWIKTADACSVAHNKASNIATTLIAGGSPYHRDNEP